MYKSIVLATFFSALAVVPSAGHPGASAGSVVPEARGLGQGADLHNALDSREPTPTVDIKSRQESDEEPAPKIEQRIKKPKGFKNKGNSTATESPTASASASPSGNAAATSYGAPLALGAGLAVMIGALGL